MQLKIKRSQKDGMIGGVTFMLDARLAFTPKEQDDVKRYKLGGLVIYNSESSKKSIAAGDSHIDGSTLGYIKSIGSFALAALKLNITVNGLEKGQHIECKTLDEVMGAEQALVEACQNAKAYLTIAATFDGREAVIDFPDA